MKKEKEVTEKPVNELDDLDKAFDDALEGLSDANAKVSEVLETMDDPEPVSSGTEVDDDGNIHEGDDDSEPESAES